MQVQTTLSSTEDSDWGSPPQICFPSQGELKGPINLGEDIRMLGEDIKHSHSTRNDYIEINSQGEKCQVFWEKTLYLYREIFPPSEVFTVLKLSQSKAFPSHVQATEKRDDHNLPDWDKQVKMTRRDRKQSPRDQAKEKSLSQSWSRQRRGKTWFKMNIWSVSFVSFFFLSL